MSPSVAWTGSPPRTVHLAQRDFVEDDRLSTTSRPEAHVHFHVQAVERRGQHLMGIVAGVA